MFTEVMQEKPQAFPWCLLAEFSLIFHDVLKKKIGFSKIIVEFFVDLYLYLYPPLRADDDGDECWAV